MVLYLVNGDIFFVFWVCGLMWMIMDDQSTIVDDLLAGWWFQPTPLKNIKVNGKDDILCDIIWKIKKSCSKPPTSYTVMT